MFRSLRRFLLLLAVVFAAFWLLRRADVLPSFKNPFRPKPVVINNTPLLVKNIQSIAQLMTIEYYDEVVVDSSRSAARLIPLPPFVFPVKTSLVLIVKGRLIAGLDIQSLNAADFKGNLDSVQVQLPRAKVLEVIVNPTDVETFSEEGEWNQAAVAALKAKAQYRITKNAMLQGVLRRSDEKARNLVEQLLVNAGYKKVVFGYR